MFIGHNGLGFALKRVAPEVSLTALFTAVQLPDLLWPALLISGVETVQPTKGPNGFLNLEFLSYPYSHSLIGTIILGLVFGLGWKLLGKERTWKGAAILGLAVISHWILDWITHVPDLPLGFTGAHKVGLGLWNSVPATMLVELLIFGGGAYLYSKQTRPVSRHGAVSLVLFVILMLLIYLANMMSPPPPSAQAVAYVGLSSWLLVAWAYWMDRSRKLVGR
jgi:hypothetical protein